MNEKRTLSRIMALAIAFAMAVIMMPQVAFAAGDSSQQASSIVEMNGQYYDHLQDAIEDAPVGTATDITLLKDAVDTKPVAIGARTGNGNKQITINLDGCILDLEVEDETALYVSKKSELKIAGDGEFNVISAPYDVDGIIISDSSKVMLTNVQGYSQTSGKSELIVYGDYYAESRAVYVFNEADVTIHGNVIVNKNSEENWVTAVRSIGGSCANIGGDITVTTPPSDKMVSEGIRVLHGGKVVVDGNVSAPLGVYAFSNDSDYEGPDEVIIKGNIISEKSISVQYRNPVAKRIYGSFVVNGNVVGAITAQGGAEITIDGTFNRSANRSEYIEFRDSITSYVRSVTPYNYDVPTTKYGYLTYSYVDSDSTRAHPINSVWVKDNGQAALAAPEANNSSDGSSSDDTYYGGSNIGTGNSTQSGAVNTDITNTVATNAAKDAVAAAKAANATIATAAFQNPANISLAALNAIDSEADMPLRLRADSMNGASVDVRITLDPARSTRALNLSASTANQAARNTVAIFKKFFDNDVMVVSLGQQGSFGQSVEIAAKLAPGLDTSNLVFYSYNAETNRYTRIATSYWVDRNGYVHFTTTLAGDIIISDGNLVKK